MDNIASYITISPEELASQNKKLLVKVSLLETEISRLQKYLDFFIKKDYGKQSERFIDSDNIVPDLPGFELPEELKTEDENSTIITEHKRRKNNKGVNNLIIPDHLEREVTVLDIPEADKLCPETNEELVEIGRDITERLAYKPGKCYVERVERPKYAKRGNALFGVVQHPAADTIIERSKFATNFMAHVVSQKYGCHMPLNRIHELLSFEGVKVSEQTMCSLVINIGQKVQPLIDLMTKKTFHQGVLFTDDTPLKLIVKGRGSAKQSYMWVYLGGKPNAPPYHIYKFSEGRSHANPIEHLKEFTGVIHADAFGAYEKLNDNPVSGIDWAACWAHARRKFFELGSSSILRTNVLKIMRNLSRLERLAWSCSPERRLEIRQNSEKKIVNNLFKYLKQYVITNFELLPKSNTAKAINYMLARETQFNCYLDNPDIRMDNNPAERALRKIVIGRKNWLFVGSIRSGESAANLFSLVQTCRALKINPQEYLDDIFTRLMAHPARKLEELLPDRWLEIKSKSKS